MGILDKFFKTKKDEYDEFATVIPDYDVLNAFQMESKARTYYHIRDYKNAIDYYNVAISKAFEMDGIEGKRIIWSCEPSLLASYRKIGDPQKAINRFISLDNKWHGISTSDISALVTVAAAYCDIEDYSMAVYSCDQAWRKTDTCPKVLREDHKKAIRNVYFRIKKESGVSTKEWREYRKTIQKNE